MSDIGDGLDIGPKIEEAMKKEAEKAKKRAANLIQNARNKEFNDAPAKPKMKTILATLPYAEEILEMIRSGETYREIARFIQEDKKDLVDMKRGTLEVALFRYAKSLPVGDLVENRVPVIYRQLVQTSEAMMDEMEALNILFAIQFDRVMIDYATEKKLGKLFSSHNETIKTAVDIAAKVGALKAKALGGFGGRGPIKTPMDAIDVTESSKQIKMEIEQKRLERIQKTYGERIAKIAADPASRRRVLSALEKLNKVGDPGFEKILNKYREKFGDPENKQPQPQANVNSPANEEIDNGDV